MADKKIPVSVRRMVAARAKHLCEYCRTPRDYAPGFFEIDHIIPVGKGGDSETENLANACDGCNNAKSDKTEAIDPITGNFFPLFHPRQDNWADHFAWSADSLIIMGLSPQGRATVEALQLNRQPLINLRKALFLVGVHPTGEK